MAGVIVHPQFAQRATSAADANPKVPPMNHGRLGWIVARLAEDGHQATIETVRKWLAGETIPRQKKMASFAKILGVDESWLALGHEPELPTKTVRARNALASGAVNLVVGVIQIAGGNPAFPSDGDKRAEAHGIDFYAIIKGAQYAFHVAVAERRGDLFHFSIPTKAVSEETVIVGVLPTSPTSFEFVEIDLDGIEATGKRKNATVEVDSGHPWRKITTFGERF